MGPNKRTIAQEVLIDLHRRLEGLPVRCKERRDVVEQAAQLYGVSESTLYRYLRTLYQPKPVRRSDLGKPRIMASGQMERYCEIIAALKIRTLNKNGRHISTVGAIQLLETSGIDSDYGFIKLAPGQLNKATVNRYLQQWNFTLKSVLKDSPAVRFQAKHSNECWQFDLSPSDLKHLQEPIWYDKQRGRPLLMLYSVVDDRSGACYQEYRNVYGEDAASALLFLFNAMTTKADPEFPFRGLPDMIYMDNGPIAKSRVFRNVMAYLGIEIKIHEPASKTNRRKTARSKGKVERAFRTVKECHEVLYHLREPKNEEDANNKLLEYLKQYNDHRHRHEEHSRMEDWQQNLSAKGIRKMCSWERFCAFAREPEQRTVGVDARIPVDGTVYEIHPDLAGERVVLWWGLFDDELFVEHESQRYGPYYPVSGPVPLYRYRKFKKTRAEKTLDKLEALAKSLALRDEGDPKGLRIIKDMMKTVGVLPVTPFVDPDPFNELTFPSILKGKVAIAAYLGKPLALLPQADKDVIDAILDKTLDKTVVMARVKDYFNPKEDSNHAT